MDISAERNILVTSSNKDSSIKIWNYLNGLSEYCSLIFSEENKENKQILKKFNILSLALHPSGYYLAMANEEMIWFFYGTDPFKKTATNKNIKRSNCYILKFCNGGHYLVAANKENIIFVINSYSREVIYTFILFFDGKINDFVFSEDDNFIYAICSNGSIFEINLISSTSKLLLKQDNIVFNSSFFYFTEELIAGKNI